MPQFTVSLDQILWFCTFVAGLWAVWKIVKEIIKPSEDLKRKVEKHDQLLDKDNQRLAQIEKSNRMALQCLLDLINHDITGNGIEKMKKTREELQDYLINK